jgi:hypothetical protein
MQGEDDRKCSKKNEVALQPPGREDDQLWFCLNGNHPTSKRHGNSISGSDTDKLCRTLSGNRSGRAAIRRE